MSERDALPKVGPNAGSKGEGSKGRGSVKDMLNWASLPERLIPLPALSWKSLKSGSVIPRQLLPEPSEEAAFDLVPEGYRDVNLEVHFLPCRLPYVTVVDKFEGEILCDEEVYVIPDERLNMRTQRYETTGKYWLEKRTPACIKSRPVIAHISNHDADIELRLKGLTVNSDRNAMRSEIGGGYNIGGVEYKIEYSIEPEAYRLSIGISSKVKDLTTTFVIKIWDNENVSDVSTLLFILSDDNGNLMQLNFDTDGKLLSFSSELGHFEGPVRQFMCMRPGQMQYTTETFTPDELAMTPDFSDKVLAMLGIDPNEPGSQLPVIDIAKTTQLLIDRFMKSSSEPLLTALSTKAKATQS